MDIEMSKPETGSNERTVSRQGGSASKGSFFLQTIITLVIVAVIVIGALYYIFVGPTTERATDWQGVFLTNGQVYFGRVVKETRSEVQLAEVYYLQVSNPLQQDGQPTPRGELSLVKLGNELHGPMDLMRLNRDHVLFTEDLKDDGKVVEAIMRHKAGEEAEVE